MGITPNADYYRYPKQGENIHKKVHVCFNRDTTKTVDGMIMRDDIEKPFVTIIGLDDGRYVLGTECQYQIID